MKSIDGEWIMQGCAEDSPLRIHNTQDLLETIREVGFLPLLGNEIPGFSVEERTCASDWWTGNPDTDPWEWRHIVVRDDAVAYGKLYHQKAGFVSKAWFPAFANYRRNGYDFEALIGDELASYRNQKIMRTLGCDELMNGKSLPSNEIRKLANAGKNPEPGLTELQMQTFLIVCDFKRRISREGYEYGWPIAVLQTPETKWGYDYVAREYTKDPAQSWDEIESHIQSLYPDATEEAILQVMGIRYPGETSHKKAGRKKKPVERKLPSEKLPYPQNLLTIIGLEKIFGTEEYPGLSEDQFKGLEYALNTLKEKERDILRYRYEGYETYRTIGERYERSVERIRQIHMKAIRKLWHPSRMEYYRDGYQVVEERKRTMEANLQRSLDKLYEEQIEYWETIALSRVGFSVRTYNCLKRAGMETLADMMRAMREDPEAVRKIRNLGEKSFDEIRDKIKEIATGNWKYPLVSEKKDDD